MAAARRQSGREYSKAGGSGVLPLVLRLVWPILFFSAYYTANFVWRTSVVAQARLAHASSIFTAELEFMAPLAGYLLRNAIFYSEPGWVAANLNASQASVDYLRSLIDSVAYGNPSLGLPSALGTNKAAYSILLDNGCVHNEVSAAACANYGVNASCNYHYPYAYCYKPPSNTDPKYPVFYFGVVGTGLLPAVQQYVLLVEAAIAARSAELAATAGGTLRPLSIVDPAVGIPGVLTSTDLNAIDKLCDAYLPAGLGALSAAVKSQSDGVIDVFTATDVIVVSLSFLALVALYVGYYRPTILALDAQLKRTRFLLLLFPEELARSVPAVVNAGRKLIEGAM